LPSTQTTHTNPPKRRFSIDELALIDLPLMIDTALEKSGATATAFVGHSQVGGGGPGVLT
jgi:hypothetical protein